MSAVTTRITARWWSGLIVLAFLLGGGALLGVVGQAEQPDTSRAGLAQGSDSRAAAELRAELPKAEGSTALVLFTRGDGPLTQPDLAAINEVAAGLPGATGAPVQTSEDGSAAITVVPVQFADSVDAKAIVDELRGAVRNGLPEGVTAEVTGPAAITADVASVFDGANVRLLISTALVVALLLVITYRSPILWLVPLTVVGLADQVAALTATHVLDAVNVLWDDSTLGILSVLVFGAGTDYAMLLISRYRDELRTTTDRRLAMTTALRRTAEAVISSATTVVLGLLTLLLSVFPATRGLGLACAVGVVVAAVAALVVLPAALVIFGRWIFWPRVPHEGTTSLADGQSFWRRIGDAVAARPTAFIVVSVVILGVMGGGLSQIKTGLTDADQFLEQPESIAAAERLGESFPAGSADPATIVTRSDPAEVQRIAEGVEGVSSVQPGQSAQGISELAAVLTDGSGTAEARRTVEALRTALADQPSTYVGGTTAQLIDEREATGRDRMVVLPVILLLVTLALGALLRSVVAPVILVSTVVLTYLASLGLSWVIFTQVFGFDRLDAGAPLTAFVFLVALGVDYNIFLVTRAKEEALGHGPRLGMLRSLAATGGVITSAGILLAAVFAVLGVLPLVVLAQVGVIICVGVLLDTLVVRTVLVPAIALKLGDAFWWPRRLR